MPITLSYDLRTDDTNARNYIRSMFERFGWKRLGGSVFRYEALDDQGEDWLNEVAPAIMLFRSYVVAKGIELRFMTLDTNSVSRIDYSDSDTSFGYLPDHGDGIWLHEPTNKQSSEKRIRRAINGAIDLFKDGGSDD